MATTTFFRKANVSQAEATASLFKRFPNVDLVSFEKKAATAEEAASAGVKEGDLVFAATIRTAEFPPAGDGGDDSSSEKEDAPSEDSAPAPKSDGGDSDDSSDSEDSSSSSDSEGDDKGNPFGGDSEGEGAKPKELKGEELTNHLLKQILDALHSLSGGGLGGPGGPGDLDLPDVGAPGQGDTLPPPAGPHAGPGGPATKAPLPPPVKEKSPVGVGAFAHVAGKAEIHMVRADAGEVNNRAIIAEAAEHAPTHMVAKIQRTGSAVVNGQTVNLAERGIALVTLVKK